MTALLWSRDVPNRCACNGAYRPQLNAKGMLVKSREPAWKMFEQRTRDKACLQYLTYTLAPNYRLGYHHNADSRKAGAGYPDVHIWAPLRVDGGGGSAYIELKRMGMDPTEVQVATMAKLQDATPGRRVYLARPCCLLVGVIDEIMAELAGTRCLYIEGNPDGPVFPIRPALPKTPHAEPTGDTPARRGPLYRPPPLPGRDPEPFAPAVGVVVTQPVTAAARAAMPILEAWLRDAGFSQPPYPIRLVTMGRCLHVHCRVGLARPGNDQRVWRAGTPASDFPDGLTAALGARVVAGPSSAAVAEQIAGAPYGVPAST